MDRHKKTLIDVWEYLSHGERNYLLKVANQELGMHLTIGALPMVSIEKFRGPSRWRQEQLAAHHTDDRVRFIKKLYRKLT